MFLCMELCYCIWIDRELQDTFDIDVLNGKECDSLNTDEVDVNSCICRTSEPIFASQKENSEILCLDKTAFKGGKKYLS